MAIGVVIEPLVAWLWAGGLLIGVGGLLALIPGSRRRPPTRRRPRRIWSPARHRAPTPTGRDDGARAGGRTRWRGAPRARYEPAPRATSPAGWRAPSSSSSSWSGIVLATRTPQEATAVQSPLLGRQAPEFTGTDLTTGAPVSLASLRGHYVVVNFFASWCIPCQEEAPDLSRFHYEQTHATDGADMVSVVFHDTSSTARALPGEER